MVRLPDGYHRSAGSWPGTSKSGGGRRHGAVPVQQYTRVRAAPIDNAYAQVVVNAQGVAKLSLGPSGLGNVWRPSYCQIATTSGASDTSTCSLYIGPLPIGPLVGGQSYAGGGDSIGLPSVTMQPGDFVWAIWTGGKTGDIASLVVYGDQTVLDTP
jgi:hypothetical protein